MIIYKCDNCGAKWRTGINEKIHAVACLGELEPTGVPVSIPPERTTDYKRIAESMALHIMLILKSLEPDEHGNHKPFSEEDVEELWLFSDIFRKCGPVNVVFNGLLDETDGHNGTEHKTT